MIELYIERNRIRMRFDAQADDDELAEVIDGLIASISSFSISTANPSEASCALSIANLRKLKKHPVRVSHDEHTRKVIADLRSKLDQYEAESHLATQAKQGAEIFNGYPFKLPPFEHQKIGFQFLHAFSTPALFGDCGVGKTYMVLTFADSLVKAEQKYVFLVVCPVNLITHVWHDDAEKFSDLSVASLREPTVPVVLASDYDEDDDPELTRKERATLRTERRADPKWKAKAKRRAQARHRKVLEERFAQDVDMYVINPENMRTAAKEKRITDLLKRRRKDGFRICLIVDESSRLKSRTSKTYRAIKRIREYAERCIIMSGTPSPNGLTDLWAQFALLDGGMTLQPDFNDFRYEFCKEFDYRGKTFKDKYGREHQVTGWAPKPGAPQRVHKIIEPRTVRFRTEDCIDLPSVRFITRHVDLNATQAETYEDLEERLFAELDGEPVTAAVATVKLMKLREVTGGFVISDDGGVIPLGKPPPKMLELDALLAQSIANKMGDDGPPSKALIWAQYRWECKTLVERYRKLYGAQGLFGGISSTAKDRAIRAFKNDPNARLLVCHPASVGHGLTLTDANYGVYYSLSHNYEEFYQSYRRIVRPGQKRHVTYYFLVSPNTIDENLLASLRQKKNLSDVVTDGKVSRDGLLAQRKERDIPQLNLTLEG